jgi:hypothetical protein
MGLESFITKDQKEPVKDEVIAEDKQLKSKWNVVLDGTKQQDAED